MQATWKRALSSSAGLTISFSKVLSALMLLACCTSVSTGESSRPLALSCIWIANFFPTIPVSSSGRVDASCPIVLIPYEFSLNAVFFPTQSRSPTSSGHIFAFTSSVQSVWTLSGFSKSEAIFASSLLEPTPTLTVNPSSAWILSFNSIATATGSLPYRRRLISMKHSSMENFSSTGE